MEYGCIGERLPHSFSKEIHERIGGYGYELLELSPEALGAFLEARDFRAVNVTIPYKEAVIPYLSALDPVAAGVGAVNTVVNRGGRLFGYNTDVFGMEALLRRAGIDPGGKKVLVLGSGGTSKTANAVARRAGAKEIVTVSRTAKPGCVTYETALAAHTDAAVIVNTTPAGMYPETDGAPLDLAPFHRLEAAVDAVYNPLRTVFTMQAQSMGAKACNGLYMLVAQAVRAYEIFTDTSAPAALIGEIYAGILAEKRNIVLIGMPGAGKTTVGRLLAASLGRPFYDTDALIAGEAGMEIPEIFAARGEAYFRDLEAACVRRVSAHGSSVIATGGGAVLREENVRRLRQNGRLYFLDRPPELLVPTADRPLAASAEAIARRYEERYPVYLAAADAVIGCGGTPAAAARETERRHYCEISDY